MSTKGSYSGGYIDIQGYDMQGTLRTFHLAYYGGVSSGNNRYARAHFSNGLATATTFSNGDFAYYNACIYQSVYPKNVKQICTSSNMPAGSSITVWYKK